jgi:phage gp29-like protein
MADDTQAQATAPELNEIATSGDGRDITRPFLGPLAYPQDPVLLSIGQRYELYRDLRRDGQVHATFQQRRLAVVSRPLVVTPGADDAKSKAAAEALEANLRAIAFDRATKLMAWGLFYGHAKGECMWERRDGRIWLAGVKVRTAWRFRFTPQGELRLLTLQNMFQGEPMPDRKFWSLSAGADNDDEPYGLGLAHQLYWPVYFKKRGLEFWLRALEKFGGPSVKGTYPAGTPKEDQDKLLAAAQALRIDSAAIFPEGMNLDLIEATRGTVDQATFLRQMNSEISKIVVGQTMTTDDGASLAQGQVHMNVREELTDADVEDLCESFQQGPARWLTEWNFPGAATPILSRPSPVDETRASDIEGKKATTLKAMADAGFEPEDATLVEQFPGWRRRTPADPQPTTSKVAPLDGQVVPAPAFAEASPAASDAIDDFTAGMDWEPVIKPLVDQVKQIILKAPTLQAAADQVGALLAGDSGAELTDLVARALFEARLAGLTDAPIGGQGHG